MNSFDIKQINNIKDVLENILEQINAIGTQEVTPHLVLLKKDRINYILNSVCDYYVIPPMSILERTRNTRQSKKKSIAIKLLRDVGDLNYREIAEIFGSDKSIESIQMRYINITSDLDKDSYGNKELKKEYADILKYLGL